MNKQEFIESRATEKDLPRKAIRLRICPNCLQLTKTSHLLPTGLGYEVGFICERNSSDSY